MRKTISFILSAVLTGMLMNAGIALAHSNHDKDRGHSSRHDGKRDHGHKHKRKHRRHHHGDTKLLTPGSVPYALQANSGKVDVTFNVELILDEKHPTPEFVYLRQDDDKGHHGHHDKHDHDIIYKLNDNGANGDLIADDGSYGATIRLGTDRRDDDCRVFDAFVLIGNHKIKSPDYSLCTTSFAVGAAPSDVRPQNLVSLAKDTSPAVANELLVRFRSSTDDGQVRAVARGVGAQVVGSILPRNLYQFRFPQALTLAQLNTHIRTLLRNSRVEDAYPNRVGTPTALPNDTEYLAGNQHGYSWINADDAWDIGADGDGITVALLDSGGIVAHADLPIAAGVDPSNHGTPMAGIVAATTDNGLGIAGVAGESTLLSYVVPAITWVDMVNNLDLINATAARVVIMGFNYTMAPPSTNFPVDDQWDLCEAINNIVTDGLAVVVTPAGNNNSDGFHYPSRCNDSSAPANDMLTPANKNRLITVLGSCTGGSCPDDTRQVDSNYGTWIDVAAPAVNLRSTSNSGGYAYFSGTSFAASLVGGVAAQLLSCGVPAPQVQSRLTSTAPVTVSYTGGNAPRIDAYAAVLAGNTAPTGIALGGATSINEGTNTSLGHVIGTLTETDANACDAFTFSIQGGADAGAFSIGGPGMDQLILTAGVLDFETKPSYSVIVRVTDAGGATFDQAFTITVNDLPEPTFTIYSVRSTYLAALGGATVLTQDFNSLAHNTSLTGFSVVPGMTVTSNMTNIIAWDPSVTVDGDVELAAFDPVGNPTRTAGIGYYEILVTGTYDAIGFDIDAFNPATPGPGVMQVFFLDGTSTSVNIFPTNATELDPVFFGVTSSQPIIRIRWNEGPEIGGSGNEETSLDNFAVANLP